MEIDVGAYIAELLYEHESVSVPGLGGFTTAYQSASIDPIQGKLHPPGKELGFNNNLTINDGLLIQYILEKHQLSYLEAERSVKEYVQKVLEAIDRREIVVFPKVGRLYKDFEQQLQFLPETTNFNLDSFGLPVVQFYPISHKSADARRPAAPAVKPEIKREVSFSNTIAGWFQRYLPYIGTLSILIIALSIFYFLREQGRDAAPDNANAKEIPSSRINTRPSQTTTPGKDAAAVEEDNAGNIDTEAITPDPGQKSAYIAIGLFSDEDNIKRLVEKIYNAGYEPFTEDVRNLKRVGIQMAYQSDTEVQKALEDIRNRFDTKAFVLRQE